MTDDAAREAAAVTRELSSNVVRHARSERVEVTIRIDEGELSVVVEDDDVGMIASDGDGHGLSNLIDRAWELGGAFSVTSRRPRGARAEWAVPLSSADRADG